MKTKRVAVILAGAGVYDGSELHEAVLSLYFLSRAGAEVQCFAPDIPQAHVVNHLTGTEMPETRNVLVEAARVARGKIQPVTALKVADFDALLMPGGFGMAKNLASFAFKGADCDIDAEIQSVIRNFHGAGKPIAALCISPAVVARAFKGSTVQLRLTIGNEAPTAAAIETFGAQHQDADPGEVVIDAANKLVSSPCYMYNSSIGVVGQGVERAVDALLAMA